MQDKQSTLTRSSASTCMTGLFAFIFLIFLSLPSFALGPSFINAQYNPPEEGNVYFDLYFSEGVWGDSAQSGPVEPGDFLVKHTQGNSIVAYFEIKEIISTDGVTALTGGETSVRCKFIYQGSADGTETIRVKPSSGSAVYDADGEAMDVNQSTRVMTMNDDNPTIIYVASDAAGANDGTTWGNAYKSLTDALAASQAENQIWIKNGIYKPGTQRTDTFNVPAGVVLLGGFAGTETSYSQRQPSTDATILSGDIGVEGTSEDNCYQVVTANDKTAFDNLTIASGYSSDTEPYNKGAGMYIPGGLIHLQRVHFTGNRAVMGGSLYVGGTLKGISCMFFDSESTTNGGAIYCSGGAVMLDNTVFYNNNAGGAGGALYTTQNWYINMRNCNFYNNNSMDGTSGAAYNVTTSGNYLNCIIRDNNGVGNTGIQIVTSTINIKNCNINGLVSDIASAIDEGGSIDADPGFQNAGIPFGADNIPYTYDDGFMPTIGASVVDAGVNRGPDDDFLGTLRPTGPNYDIGAYEQYDPLNPPVLIQSVKAVPLTGAYKSNDVISIAVAFTGTVGVSGGTPRIALEAGSSDRYAQYSSGSNSSVLNFSYTVISGDSSADLAYLSSTSLDLQGAVITDISGRLVTLKMPVPGQENSLSRTSDIQIDTVQPLISQANLSQDNSYLDITFSEPVSGRAADQSLRALLVSDFIVQLTPNGGDAQAVSISSLKTAGDQDLTGAASVIRAYLAFDTVPSGQETIVVKPFDGSSVFDDASNNLDSGQSTGAITLNEPALTGPSVTGVTSTDSDGSYGPGDTVTIQVTFAATVIVTGAPELTLETGEMDRKAVYQAGSGSATLVFQYQIQSGDSSADLSYISTEALSVSTDPVSSIKGTTGLDAVLTLPIPGQENSLSHNKNIIVDSQSPGFADAAASGDNTFISLSFTEPVTGPSGVPLILSDLNLTFTASGQGAENVTADSLKTSGGAEVTGPEKDFRIMITVTGTPAFGDYVKITPSAANRIFDLSNVAMESGSATGNIPLSTSGQDDITISSVTAAVTSGVYGPGDTFDVKVNFSGSVKLISGMPVLVLESGYNDIQAQYASGSNSSTFVFNASVPEGASASDLDYGSVTALKLDGVYMAGLNGQTVVTTLPEPGKSGSLSANADIVVDTLYPSIKSSVIAPANAYVEIDFTEEIAGQGADKSFRNLVPSDFSLIFSASGGTASDVKILSLVKTDGTALSGFNSIIRFMLEVQGQASGVEKIEITPASLTSIYDRAGNSMPMGQTTGNINLFSATQTIPVVTAVTALTEDGIYKAGDVVEIAVDFSASVIYTGTPVIKMALGESLRAAVIKEGSNTSRLVFSLTLQAGDNSSDLDYVSAAAITVSDGSIIGTGTEPVSLMLPTPGQSGSISSQKDIVVDTRFPVIQSITLSQDNSTAAIKLSEKSVHIDSNPLTKDDFRIVFESNGGTAGSAVITGLRNIDGNPITQAVSEFQALISITGQVSGLERMCILPVDNSIRDLAGNMMSAPDPYNPLPNQNPGTQPDNNPHWVTLNSQAVSAAAITLVSADPTTGSYKAGEDVSIKLRFSSSVQVTGTPKLILATQPVNRFATYSQGSGTNTLTFVYTVQTGDFAEKLSTLGAGAIALDSGSIKYQAPLSGEELNATLTMPAAGSMKCLNETSSIRIDAQVPLITSSFLSEDNTFVDIYFSEAVTNGSGNAIGISDISLDFQANLGTAQNVTITGITGIDGISLSGASDSIRVYISVQGSVSGSETISVTPATESTVKDGSSNFMAATQTTGALTLRINSGTITVKSVSAASADGYYNQGDTIEIKMSLTGNVNVTGTPELSLETGEYDSRALYVSGSGTSVLTFNYTVAQGHESKDLNYINVNSIILSNGTMSGSASSFDKLLPESTSENSLAGSSDIVVDTVIPKIIASNMSQDNSYVDLIFSEPLASHDFSTLSPDDFTLGFTSNSGAATSASIAEVTDQSDVPLTGTADRIRLKLNFNAVPSGPEVINITPSGAGVIIDRASNSMAASESTGDITVNTPNYDTVKVERIIFEDNQQTLLKSGEKAGIKVLFTREVTVTGTPLITLDTGSEQGTAYYVSMVSPRELLFEYTVLAGHCSRDLDYTAIGALQNSGGTISDENSISAVLTLPAPGSEDSLAGSSDVVVDAQSPEIINITIARSNSYCELFFSEPVSGPSNAVIAPQNLDLEFFKNTGTATDLNISGFLTSGGAPLTGPESVLRINLSVVGTPSGDETFRILPANATSVYDQAGNAMDAAQMSTLKNLFSAALSPDISVVSLDSPTADNVYKEADTIAITLAFSGVVTVEGSPVLCLNVNSGFDQPDLEEPCAVYESGSGTSVLTFTYNVRKNHYSENLDVKNSQALKTDQINRIIDSSGRAVNTSLPMPGSEGSLSHASNIRVDSFVPYFSSLNVSSDNTRAELVFSEKTGPAQGQQLTASDFEIMLNKNGGSLESISIQDVVTIIGTAVNDYETRIIFNLQTTGTVSGAESIALKVVNSDVLFDTALNTVLSGSKSPYAVLHGTSGTGASITEVTAQPAAGEYKAGDVIDIHVKYSDIVYISGNPVILLNAGENASAVYMTGSGTDTIRFSYTVAEGHNTEHLMCMQGFSFDPSGASILSAGGAAAELNLPASQDKNSLSENSDIVIDTAIPVFSSADAGSDNSYVELYFSEAVKTLYMDQELEKTIVSSDFSVEIDTNGGTASTATATAVQTYRGAPLMDVTSGLRLLLDYDAPPTGVEKVRLKINSPALFSDTAGNKIAADTWTSWFDLRPSNIDVPLVLSIGTPYVKKAYKQGDVIDISAAFSKVVNVTGTPRLLLDTNASSPVYADYVSGSSSPTLLFKYTVQAGDDTGLLKYPGVYSLENVNGLIAGVNGTADIELPYPGSDHSLSEGAEISIDTSAPVMESAVLSGDNTALKITFSERVYNSEATILSKDDFTIDFQANGGTVSSASITDITDENNLPLSAASSDPGYKVLVFKLDFQGEPSGREAFKLSPSADSVFDSAGNRMSVETSSGWMTLNTEPDTGLHVEAIDFISVAGGYGAGETIKISVKFSESIVVQGTPRLKLETGAEDRYAVYTEKTGTDTIELSYVIENNDSSASLDYHSSSALELQGGSITSESSGESADLTLPVPGTDGSLSSSAVIIIDTAAPQFISGQLAADNTYVDILFDSGIYADQYSSSAISSDKFTLIFTKNSGTAENVTISEVKEILPDGTVQSPSPGASRYRLMLNISGDASGAETILIRSRDGYSLFDIAGNPMAPEAGTGTMTLNFVEKVFSVSGTVLLNSSPMPDVTVTLVGMTSEVTDAQGAFSLSDIPEGDYYLVPSKAGYIFEPDRIALSLGPDRTGLTFTASAGVGEVVFGGVIKDTDGNPVPLTQIQIPGKSSVETNEDGRWLKPGMTSGVYTVIPYKENYSFNPTSRQVAADVNQLALDFEATYTGSYYNVSGITATSGNVPIGGVTVKIEGGSSVQSSSSGEFFIGNLKAGTYIVTASKEGYVFEPASRTVSLGPSATGQNFTGTFNASPAGVTARYIKFTYSEFNNPVWFQLNEISIYDSTLTVPGEVLPVSTIITSKPAYQGFEKETLVDSLVEYNQDMAIRNHNGSVVITIDLGSNKNFHTIWHYTDGEYGASGVKISAMAEDDVWKDLGDFRATVTSGQANLDIFQFTSKILINEVNSDDPSWVELVNTGNTTANLRHWSLYHDQGIFSLPDIVLLPGQYVVIHEGAGTNSSGNIYSESAFSWTKSSSGYAYLVNHEGKGYDFVKWNDSSQVPPGDLSFEGPSLSDTEQQKTVGRDKNHVDTDKSSDFFTIEPSPGAVNVVPENIEKFNISGQINDSGSFVMEGVTVSVGDYSAVTDSMGKFTILNVPAGTYTLAPVFDGYTFEPASMDIDLQENVSDKTFIGTAVAPPVKYSLRGTIYLSSGDMTPVAGITVELNSGSVKTVTDLSGVYLFSNLEKGDYTVAPVDTGYNFYPSIKNLTMDQNRLNENFTAQKVVQTYTIDGYVKQTDGTAISGVSVEMGSVEGAHEIIQTNSTGYFKFAGLKQDYYRIIVAKQFWEFSPSYQDIENLNEDKRLEIFVGSQPEYEISGFVTNIDGQGVEGVSIDISGIGAVETDAFGAYRKIQVLPGAYIVTPSKGDLTFNPSSRTIYIGPSQSQVNFSAVEDRYNLFGRINKTIGGPLQNAKVTITNSTSNITKTTYTSGVGEYIFTDLAEDVYTVTPELAGYTFDPPSMSATLNSEYTSTDFTAAPESYKISGMLYDHLGTGVSGVTVFLGDVMTYSDNNGHYEFNSVTAGDYEVKAVSDTYSFEPLGIAVRVGPDSSSNNFTGTRSYSLSGRVTDSNGTGVEAAEVTVAPGQKVYSDSSGNYIVRGIGPGDYRVSIKKDGYTFVPSENTFTVTNSDTTQDFTATYLGTVAVINVDQSYTGTVEDGSQSRPYKTINSAISVSDPGTVISVSQGDYNGPVVLPFGVSLKGAGPDKTFINGNGQTRVVQMSNNCSLSDLCVRGSSYYAGSSGVYAYDSSIDIKNCIVTNCYDGIRAIKSNVNIRNITVSGNYGSSINLEDISSAWISSSILNRVDYDSTCQVFVNYSNIVQGGTAVGTGTGNITEPPGFTDSAQYDFTLRSNSPCVDMGDPSADLKDTDLTRNDMGAFGGPGDTGLNLTVLSILDITSSIPEITGYEKEKLHDSLKTYNSDFAVEYGDNTLVLTIDMGKDILCSQINLYNDGLYGVRSVTIYEAPASNPDAWTKKGDFSGLEYESGTVKMNELIFTAATCRYLRMQVNSAVDARWIQLNELEVLGVDPGGTSSGRITYNQVTSSAAAYSGYGTDKLYNGQKVYNGDFAVRHGSQPVTLSIDLGNVYKIDRIDIYNDGLYGAKEAGLFLSNQAIDGVYSYAGTYSGLNISDKNPVLNTLSLSTDTTSARYVRLVFSDFGDASYFQLNEIEFVGTLSAADNAYKCEISQIECSQSAWPGYNVSNLVDGKMVYNGDFAVNKPVSPLDISIDLGVTRRISQLRIYNDGLHGAPEVGVWYATASASLDWKSLGLSNLGFQDQQAHGNTIPIVPRDLRYIKLRFETFNSASWFQLNEIEVYSSVEIASSQRLTIADVTTDRDTVAGMGADNLNDNSIAYNSEFALRYPAGTIEIIADMGSDVAITGINHYNDGIYGAVGVKISSATQSNYPVFSDITESNNLVNLADQPNKNSFTFIQRTARYIKFTYTDFNNFNWFQLCEYEVFGPNAAASPASVPGPSEYAIAYSDKYCVSMVSQECSEKTSAPAVESKKEKDFEQRKSITKISAQNQSAIESKKKILIRTAEDLEALPGIRLIKNAHEKQKFNSGVMTCGKITNSDELLSRKYALILNIHRLTGQNITFESDSFGSDSFRSGSIGSDSIGSDSIEIDFIEKVRLCYMNQADLLESICTELRLFDFSESGVSAVQIEEPLYELAVLKTWCDIVDNPMLRKEGLNHVILLEEVLLRTTEPSEKFNLIIDNLEKIVSFLVSNRARLTAELNHPGYQIELKSLFEFIIGTYPKVFNEK